MKDKTSLSGLSRPIYAPITDSWLAFSPLPSMDGIDGVAERLVLLIHYGVDFSIWGNNRRMRYWDALAERVRASTYKGPTLSAWWGEICNQIVSSPRNSEERSEALLLLGVEEQRAVLNVLRNHSEVLVLRVRVISEYKKSIRNEVSE